MNDYRGKGKGGRKNQDGKKGRGCESEKRKKGKKDLGVFLKTIKVLQLITTADLTSYFSKRSCLSIRLRLSVVREQQQQHQQQQKQRGFDLQFFFFLVVGSNKDSGDDDNGDNHDDNGNGNNGDDDDDDNDDDGSFRPHIKTRPDYVTLKLPVKFREEMALISNKRKEGSLRHQSEVLSEMVLSGDGNLKDFPCATTTMKK